MKSITTNPFIWFTIPLVLLQTLVALVGVFSKNFYSRDTLTFASAIRGTDIVSLVVIVPLLLFCLSRIRKNSKPAYILWLGTSGIIAYNYTIASFNVRFNPLFLAYTALLGLSVYALVGGAVTIKAEEFTPRFPRPSFRTLIGVFQIMLAVLFYGIWLKAIIPAHLQNVVTRTMEEWNVITNAVYVIDLAVILPAWILGGSALLRHKAYGYVLSGINLVFITLMAFCLSVSYVYMHFTGHDIKFGRFVVYVGIFVFSTFLTWKYLTSIQE